MMFQSQTRRLLPRNVVRTIAYSRLPLFQSQTRRLLPRNTIKSGWVSGLWTVSIADATLASPQHAVAVERKFRFHGFNRRRDACFPATRSPGMVQSAPTAFQSQTRRLLPRNRLWTQTPVCRSGRFNRRRDACFPATRSPA